MNYGQHDIKLHTEIHAAPVVQYQPVKGRYMDFALQNTPEVTRFFMPALC